MSSWTVNIRQGWRFKVTWLGDDVMIVVFVLFVIIPINRGIILINDGDFNMSLKFREKNFLFAFIGNPWWKMESR